MGSGDRSGGGGTNAGSGKERWYLATATANNKISETTRYGEGEPKAAGINN